MKRFVIWILAEVLLMIGFPSLAVAFAGDNGMAICFILFFVINPIFSAICGAIAGRDIKKLWSLPLITSLLFLAGVWLFFDFGETAFLFYAAAYFIISTVTMSASAILKRLMR